MLNITNGSLSTGFAPNSLKVAVIKPSLKKPNLDPDLCGLYSALSQDGKLVVEDIPLVVWGLCFGKVDAVISFLFGPVWGCTRMGPQCLLTPPVSASSIYAAVVYVSGG
ncbi:unnamed protein product [Oncorhynchus mykiss]|uniref:Uncharacterized protein n=1 Tax=Oncorhynchus mykiss TaxID=8022 RepID=A0A060XHZ3_ONCMY|nr:unnamed protein product [Oncorhynchus mykiss]